MKRWQYFILLTVALVPMFALRDYTPDNELRYLSIADEALRNGHLFAFYNQGIAYADKPPLYLWMVMLCRLMLGRHSLLCLGVLSVVPAMVVLWVMDRWSAGMLPRRSRRVAEMLLVTTCYFLGAMMVLRMDMLMTMFIVLALYTFYGIYEGKSGRCRQWLLGLWVFLALFTKGPYGVLIPLLSIIAFLIYKKSWHKFAECIGWRFWTILLALSAMWIAAAYAEGGAEYVRNLLFHQTMERAVNAFTHKKGVLFYITTMPLTMAPWILLYAIEIIGGALRHGKLAEIEQFFLAVILTSLVLLSCVSSKLEIYLLPVYPFVSYLAVMQLDKEPGMRGSRVGIFVPAVLLSLVLPAFLVVRANNVLPEWIGVWEVMAIAIALTVAGVVALSLLYRKNGIYGAIAVLGAGILCAVFIAGFAMPRVNAEIGYGSLARAGEEMGSRGGIGTGYCSYRVTRASGMDVYLHHRVEEATMGELLKMKHDHRQEVVFLRQSDVQSNDTLRCVVGKGSVCHVGKYCVVELKN